MLFISIIRGVLIMSHKNNKKLAKSQLFVIARRQGFEPRYSGPEPDVLPLDDLRFIISSLDLPW